MTFTYHHTHVSVEDGSPAMRVSEDPFVLINEDGYAWLAEPDEWEKIYVPHWEVFDHVTGTVMSTPQPQRVWASSICAALNTRESGGRFGVRKVQA